MQHQSRNRKNNRTPDLDIPTENMEQPDCPSTLQGSSQNLGMQKPKNQDDSSAGRAMLKKVFSFLVENYKLTCHGIKQLPLPPMMISKMKRIFSAAESLVYAPNCAHEYGPRICLQMTGKHALRDCKLQ